MTSRPGTIDLRDDAVLYQPVVDLSRREVVAVEALLPWDDADQADQSIALGQWLLDTACRQAAVWNAQGLGLEMAVPVSAAHATEALLVEDVRRALRTTGIEPAMLLLEVTEPTLTADAQVGRTLVDLADLGVRLALTNFGTGHSSLLDLRRHPIAALKIEGSFVAGLGSSRDDEAIVAGVASLAGAVGARCIAEGVETPEQQTQLQALRCQAQGSLFSDAVPAAGLPAAVDRAEAVLESGPPRRTRTRAASVEVAPDVAAQMREMHRAGASLQTIAAALNRQSAPHPKGTRWHATSVARHLAVAMSQRTAHVVR